MFRTPWRVWNSSGNETGGSSQAQHLERRQALKSPSGSREGKSGEVLSWILLVIEADRSWDLGQWAVWLSNEKSSWCPCSISFKSQWRYVLWGKFSGGWGCGRNVSSSNSVNLTVINKDPEYRIPLPSPTLSTLFCCCWFFVSLFVCLLFF